MVYRNGTGPGCWYRPEHLLEIFERFYRVPNLEIANGEGSGLGLAICKGSLNVTEGKSGSRAPRAKGAPFPSPFLCIQIGFTAMVRNDQNLGC